MLGKLKQKHNEGGFTIIEVMIVLAIAGLIMIVVFLAVPALQRSGRNNSRKADVANILGAAGTYVSNNAGAISFTNSDLTGDTKLGYYTAANVTVVAGVGTLTTPSVDKVVVYTAAKCGTTPTADPVAGSTRQYAAQYLVESGTTPVKQCQDG